ncbi:PEK protein kinase [Pseudoloma neurophilia]|uniref:PEK protein kinase n=1 Tax=Pseudoloma neurophilia TaxID=146866 RepID=A0A0R0M6F0_9MICR|nr:PEK protein kinase [Pseudoloma neurophilia]
MSFNYSYKWNNIAIKEKLGEGSFSKVYKIVDINTGEVFALKEIKKFNQKNIQNELLPPNLIHKNILNCKNIFMAERPFQLQILNKSQDEYFMSSDSDVSSSGFSSLDSNMRESMCETELRKEFVYIVSDFCDLTLTQFIRLRNDFLVERMPNGHSICRTSPSERSGFQSDNKKCKSHSYHSIDKNFNENVKNIQNTVFMDTTRKAELIGKKKPDFSHNTAYDCPYKTDNNRIKSDLLSFCLSHKNDQQIGDAQSINMGHFDTHFKNNLDKSSNISCLCIAQSLKYESDDTRINRLFCAKIFVGIVEGTLFLHSNNVVHSDLKSNNILLKCTENGLLPKLCDFGLRKTMKNVKKDIQGLGLIYFEMLNMSSTVMELDKAKAELKTQKIFPPGFEQIFDMEAKIILRCMETKRMKIGDTRVLISDMTSICESLETCDKKKDSFHEQNTTNTPHFNDRVV